MAALLLVVLGAKLWVIQAYGTAIPYWDQWDEANLFFKPWLEGHLTWGAWFAPHNEHRIFFTPPAGPVGALAQPPVGPQVADDHQRIYSHRLCLRIGVLPVGFYRSKTRRADLFSAHAIFRASICGREHDSWISVPDVFSGTYFRSSPWSDWGFGSPGGGWWFCGLAASVMALFTMGSGLLASLAVIGLLGLRWLKGRSLGRGGLVTLGL